MQRCVDGISTGPCESASEHLVPTIDFGFVEVCLNYNLRDWSMQAVEALIFATIGAFDVKEEILVDDARRTCHGM